MTSSNTHDFAATPFVLVGVASWLFRMWAGGTNGGRSWCFCESAIDHTNASTVNNFINLLSNFQIFNHKALNLFKIFSNILEW